MKTIDSFSRSGLSTLFAVLVSILTLGEASLVQAQSLIADAAFFNPDFQARRPGSGSLLLSLTINTTDYTPASQPSGDVTWTHTSNGLVQIGASVPLVGTVDVQLAAYTQTAGNTLVFGRELDINTTGLVGSLGSTITNLTDQVLGASVANSWASEATVGNLSLSQGQQYLVSLQVQTGSGIDLNALSAANFSLLNGGNPITNIHAQQTIDVLNLLELGGGLGNISFQFTAAAPMTDLTFAFDASTVADANLLGTIADNQTVLQFSNFSLAPVPEASSMILASFGVLWVLRRHRHSRWVS